MKNYETMDEMLKGLDLHNIAFADYAEENTKLAFYIDGKQKAEIVIAYDNMDKIQEFCNDIEYMTNGELKAVEIFDKILDAYAEQYVDAEIENEDEYGNIWHTTVHYEIEVIE